MELVKKGYKHTEVGLIPDDWKLSLIGDILEFKNGLNKESQYFGYGTPIINYMDVYKNYGISKEQIKGKVFVDWQEQQSFSAKKGDVFFTRTSETVFEIGISAVLSEDIPNCVFSGFLLRGRSKNELLNVDFKKYCFLSNYIRRQIISTSSYTTRALTNGKLLSNVKLALPPTISEQKAIATALSDVDELINNLDKLIAKKKGMKQGAMQELLTGKKRLTGFENNLGYKQTEVGLIPEDWTLEPISDFSKIITGSKDTQDRNDEGAYPFFVRSQKVERIHSYSFDGEAILTAGDGVGVGKIFHYINGKFDFHQRVYNLYDYRENVDGKFLFFQFSTKFYDRVMSMTAKSSVDSVRREMIADMKIPLAPTLTEQKAIATVISDIGKDIESFETNKVKYQNIKQGMMQELLTGKTRLV